MGREVIGQKLESLRRRLGRVRVKRPATAQTQPTAFEILAQAGIIPAALALRLKKAVGFRNVAVHNYEAIDWVIMHSIAKGDVGLASQPNLPYERCGEMLGWRANPTYRLYFACGFYFTNNGSLLCLCA